MKIFILFFLMIGCGSEGTKKKEGNPQRDFVSLGEEVQVSWKGMKSPYQSELERINSESQSKEVLVLSEILPDQIHLELRLQRDEGSHYLPRIQAFWESSGETYSLEVHSVKWEFDSSAVYYSFELEGLDKKLSSSKEEWGSLFFQMNTVSGKQHIRVFAETPPSNLKVEHFTLENFRDRGELIGDSHQAILHQNRSWRLVRIIQVTNWSVRPVLLDLSQKFTVHVSQKWKRVFPQRVEDLTKLHCKTEVKREEGVESLVSEIKILPLRDSNGLIRIGESRAFGVYLPVQDLGRLKKTAETKLFSYSQACFAVCPKILRQPYELWCKLGISEEIVCRSCLDCNGSRSQACDQCFISEGKRKKASKKLLSRCESPWKIGRESIQLERGEGASQPEMSFSVDSRRVPVFGVLSDKLSSESRVIQLLPEKLHFRVSNE